MTVEELRETLLRFPQEEEIKVTWEGTLQNIETDSIYQALDGGVIIDADSNFYKDGFTSGRITTK